jgi:hypothetical protein
MNLLVSLHDFDIEQRGSEFYPQGVPQDDVHLCTAGGSEITQIEDMPPTQS